MFGMRLSITSGRRSAIAGQKRVGWRGRLGEGRVVTERPGQPQFVPPKRTDLGCRMVAAGLSGSLAEGSWATISLQISGGPQGSRTPDLRRAKAQDSVLYRHTWSQEVTDFQGNREGA